MKLKLGLAVLVGVFLIGCAKPLPPKEVVVKINDYEVSSDEFEEGFAQSPYALRENKVASRKEYMDNLINQKLIVQDAVRKNIDKQKDFMRSVERFWEQSLMTIALGTRTKEIHNGLRVPDDNIKHLYDQMIRDGVTAKSYEEMYPQIKWQAERQMEGQLLTSWMEGLRKGAQVQINDDYFQKTR